MIVELSVLSVNAPQQSFCFDCTEHIVEYSPLAAWFGLSLVFAIPSFVFACVFNRVCGQMPMALRLLCIAISVPTFWFLWFFSIELFGEGRRLLQSFASATEDLKFVYPVLVGALLLVIVASYLDARRVLADRAHGYSCNR